MPRFSRGLDIELAHVRLRRGTRSVLRDINWRVSPGQHWAVLGANGAGKTQLLKLLSGDVWPTPAAGSSRRYRWRGEIHTETAPVREYIAWLGAERQDRYEHYGWNFLVRTVVGTGLQRSDIPLAPFTAAERGAVARILQRAGISALANRRFLSLSYGERRLTLLARALAWRPALLLLDEPLNGLDAEHRQRALQLIAKIGVSLPTVFTTHRAEDIPAHTTHRLELARGQILRQGRWRAPASGVMVSAARLGGAAARAQFSQRAPTATGARATPLIIARNANVWLDRRLVLRRLDFSIAAGDCWIVHGANGSGKSTLLRALYGDIGVASHGEICRRGIDAGVALNEIRMRVGFVAPEWQALHPLHLRVLEVVVSGLHASVGLAEHSKARERRAAMVALRSLGAGAWAGRELRELSYGQLRRVLFARALVRQPDILLLDEPYAGLDATVRQQLMRRVDAFLAAGGTLVLSTHHRDDWPRQASHELQLRVGRALYCGPVRRR